MKYLLLIICVFISINGYTQTDSLQDELTKEQIYRDVKSAISSLGETLKVGSEHVYSVLIRQQIVKSITYMLLIIILSIIVLKLISIGRKNYNELKEKTGKDFESKDIEDYPDIIAPFTFSVIIGIVLTVTTIVKIESVITGFINPEYGAIEEILKAIR